MVTVRGIISNFATILARSALCGFRDPEQFRQWGIIRFFVFGDIFCSRLRASVRGDVVARDRNRHGRAVLRNLRVVRVQVGGESAAPFVGTAALLSC